MVNTTDKVPGFPGPFSHLTREQTIDFLEGRLPSKSANAAALHLLRCSECQAVARKLVWGISREEIQIREPTPRGVSNVLKSNRRMGGRRHLSFIQSLRHIEVRAKQETRDAVDLWDELSALDRVSRQMKAIHETRFHTWAFVGRILSEVQMLILKDPGLALELADLAFTVSGLLDESTYRRELISDARGQSLVEIANCLRVLHHFDIVSPHLGEALRHLSMGTGDILTFVRLDSVRASLLIDTGEFEDAALLLHTIANKYRRLHEMHLYGRTKIKEAALLRHYDPDQGYKSAQVGLEHLDDSDEYTRICGIYNLIDNLLEAGQIGKALLYYQRHEPEFKASSQDRAKVFLRFAAARLNFALGVKQASADKALAYRESAALCYEQSIEDFVSLGLHQQAALASLYFVEFLVTIGRNSQAIDACMAAVETLKACGLPLHTVNAMILLENVLRRKTSTVTDISRLLNRLRELYARKWKIGFEVST